MKKNIFLNKFFWLILTILWVEMGYSQKINPNVIPYPIPQVQQATNNKTGLKAGTSGINLTPYKPSTWDNIIVLSTVKDNHVSATSINDHQTIYLDWAIINNGSSDITNNFNINLYIDDILQGQWQVDALKSNYYLSVSDMQIDALPAGKHRFKIVADANNDLQESNEDDNEYSRIYEIQLLVIPDISINPPTITISKTKSTIVKANIISSGTNHPIQVDRLPDSLIEKTFIDKKGQMIDVVKVPGSPPSSYRMKAATTSPNAVTLHLPAYNWSFGCAATSAAMIAGYYDQNGYPNIYSGPTNEGLMPMTNSIWGYAMINGEKRAQCPLSATRDNVDGRTTRGFVDDYWVKNNSSEPDPYITNGWTQHEYADCTGDFMKTGQSAFDNDDGATVFYYYSDGSQYTGTDSKDGGYGFEQFLESRGYTVTKRYNQYIMGYNDNDSVGFTFNDYVSEINAGYPVIIHIKGHAMVGYGYNIDGDTLYIHDTWDYSNHTMVWGGNYSDKEHFAVTVIEVKSTVPTNSFNIYNVGNDTLRISNITSNKEWLTISGTPGTPFSIAQADSQNVSVSINWSLIQSTSSGTITIYSDDPDQPSALVYVTAVSSSCTSPDAPTIGTITQPTCSDSTGSVVLKGLPSGNWIINPGNVSGTTDSTTIKDLSPGTYNFTVTNDSGCTSDASADVVINPQPETPPTPTISLINDSTLHSSALTGNQWYNNQIGLLDNAIDQDYIAKTDGDYYAIVTLNGCPSDTSNVITVTITSVNLYRDQKMVKIYPNPFTKELIIVNKGTAKNINFKIISSTGQVLYRGKFDEETRISTTNFEPGVYIIKFENSKSSESQKVIKIK